MGQIHRGEYKEVEEITFAEFAEKWLSDYAKVKVRPSTYRFYEGIVSLHLVPHFGQRLLTNITVYSVEEYLAKRLKEGKLSPTTIGYHLRVLKTVLKRAVKWGYLRVNPAQDMEKPKPKRKEMDFLTTEEINLFLANVSPEYYPLFLTAILTGMRRGELLGLQWGDIDWSSSRIFIRRSLWRGKFVPVKSERSIRKIVMTPKLASVLKRHKIACPVSDPLTWSSLTARESLWMRIIFITVSFYQHSEEQV